MKIVNIINAIRDGINGVLGVPSAKSSPDAMVAGPPTGIPAIQAPVPPPRFDPPADTTSALALFRAINSARTSHGKPALIQDAGLSGIAAAWAARMAATGKLDHGDFAGRLSAVRPGLVGGEDIGAGYPTAAGEVAGWMADPPHRAILLGDYHSVGVGVGVSRDGRLWWVADFVG